MANVPAEVKEQMMLRWAVENSTTSEVSGMDPVRKAEAMKNIKDLGPEWYEALFGKSDVEVMKEQIVKLQNFVSSQENKDVSSEYREKVEIAVDALEQLGFLVEMTHNANDLPKIGGLQIIVKLLENIDEEQVRLHSAWIIAKAASNNPEFQEKVLSSTNALPLLIQMIDNDPCFAVRGKALHAISSIVRNSVRGMQVFIANSGFQRLGKIMRHDDRNVQARCIFFLTYCLSADSSGKLVDIISEEGIVEKVLQLLEIRDFDLREKCVLMLTELSKVGGELIQVVMLSLGAVDRLQKLIDDEITWMKDDPEIDHTDLVEIAKDLQKPWLA